MRKENNRRLGRVLGQWAAALCLATAAPNIALAFPEDPDPAFGTDGIVLATASPPVSGQTVSDTFYGAASVLQPDGSIVIAGNSLGKSCPTGNDVVLARYSPTGVLDPSFGTGGIVTQDFGGLDCARAIALQSDGKLVVAYLDAADGFPSFDYKMTRFTSTGAIDTSYGTGGTVSVAFIARFDFLVLALQADGKILVGGNMDFSTDADFALARYNTDGSIDTGFNCAVSDSACFSGTPGVTATEFGSLTEDFISALAIQLDGKILAGGQSEGKFALVRYNKNGTRDLTFNRAGTLPGAIVTDFNTGGTDQITGLAVQGDGKIIAAGTTAQGSTVADFALARYLASGAPDVTFGHDDFVQDIAPSNAQGRVVTDVGGDDFGNAMVVQADGKILVAGTSDGTYAVARYDRNGNLDQDFGFGGTTTEDLDGSGLDEGNSMTLQPDGMMVVNGFPGLVRFEGDPPTFDAVVVQPAGFTLSIPAGRTSATGKARVIVRNADPVQTLHGIKLNVAGTTCPVGVTVGTPDFDLVTAGAQDTYPIAGGRSRVAFVPITASRDAVTTINYRAPFRCTITFTSSVPSLVGSDTTPENDTATLELNVRDFNDQLQSAPMESYLLSANPVQVVIGRGLLYGQRFAAVVVGSADTFPTKNPGYLIEVTASDGTCPAGTVGPVNFKLGFGDTVNVPGGQVRVGLLPIAVNQFNFTTPNGVLSPSRCVANLAITTPASDTGLTNNSTNLVIDVIDLNDF